MLPTIEELNAWNPKDHDAYMDWLREERKQRGDNWNFKYIQPFTHGHNIGTLQLARINGEEYLGYGWSDVKRFGEHEWMGKKWENPQWIVELSRDSMQRYATPWVASKTVEITVDYHAMKQVGSMSKQS